MFDLANALFREVSENLLHYIDQYQKSSQLKQEKLRLLDNIENRLNRIQVVARLNGVSEYELSNLAIARLKNKLGKPTSSKKRIPLVIVGIVTLLSLFFLICTPCQRITRMYGRKVLFQLEPYWDWQDVYYTRCLVPTSLFGSSKPIQPDSKLSSESCDYCEEVSQVTFLAFNSFQHNQSKLEERFAFNMANKIPFIYYDSILTNEIQSWPLYGLNEVRSWKKFFNQNDHAQSRFCMFKSNMVSVLNPGQLFADIDTFDPDFWFAHWENCATRAMKLMRRLFVRPSVLPAMVELSKPNWILMSGWSDRERNISLAGKTYKQISPMHGTDLLIVVQIHGQVQLKLTPTRYGCGHTCVTLQPVPLEPHQMAIISATHWNLSYRPVMMTETIPSNVRSEVLKESNRTETGFNLSLVIGGIHV